MSRLSMRYKCAWHSRVAMLSRATWPSCSVSTWTAPSQEALNAPTLVCQAEQVMGSRNHSLQGDPARSPLGMGWAGFVGESPGEGPGAVSTYQACIGGPGTPVPARL